MFVNRETKKVSLIKARNIIPANQQQDLYFSQSRVRGRGDRGVVALAMRVR